MRHIKAAFSGHITSDAVISCVLSDLDERGTRRRYWRRDNNTISHGRRMIGALCRVGSLLGFRSGWMRDLAIRSSGSSPAQRESSKDACCVPCYEGSTLSSRASSMHSRKREIALVGAQTSPACYLGGRYHSLTTQTTRVNNSTNHDCDNLVVHRLISHLPYPTLHTYISALQSRQSVVRRHWVTTSSLNCHPHLTSHGKGVF